MEILKNLYTLIFVALLMGCSEEVTLDIDPKPVLCLNSMVKVGEPIEIAVTHTWLYTDEEAWKNHAVKDAMVSIYANGAPVVADYLPREGDTIRIVAESKAYGNAEAEVVVPVSVPIASLKWDAQISHVSETDRDLEYYINMQGNLTINDPAAPMNYYEFSYKAFPWGVGDDGWPIDRFRPGTFYAEAEPIFSEHIGEIDMGIGPDGFSFFTDRQFSGKSYTLNLIFRDMTLTIDNNDLSEDMLDCGLVVTLNSISQSLYNWNCYMWNLRNGSIMDLGEFGFADPVWGYSNVSTGAGVVAALSSRSDTIRLKDFLQQNIHMK